jgi:homoprotocatechuate degradation regulator HpaR
VKLQHPNLPLLLLQARERLLSHFRPILNAHGFTEQQWRIARVLLETSPLEPRQISEICCISSPSLVGVLSRMRQLGLISRRPVAHDQRRVLISLTTKGRSLAGGLVPEIEAAYRRIEDEIGESFINGLRATLSELLATLKPHAEPVEDSNYAPVRAAR